MSKTYLFETTGVETKLSVNMTDWGAIISTFGEPSSSTHPSTVQSVYVSHILLRKMVERLYSDSIYETWREVMNKNEENKAKERIETKDNDHPWIPRICIELDYTTRGPINKLHAYKISDPDIGYAISGDEDDLATSISTAIRGWLRYKFNQSDRSFREVFSRSHYLRIHLE